MDILVIRFSSLGDVVLVTGALRAIGHFHPEARLIFVTKPVYQPLLENFDIPLVTLSLHPDRLLRSARNALKGTKFAFIVDLHGSIRSLALSRLLRADRRLQIEKHSARRRAMVKKKAGLDQPLSVLGMYGETIAPLGIGPQGLQPRLFLSPDEASRAATLRNSASPCLGIGWGARWPTKAVPPQTWASLLAEVGHEKYDCLRIFGLEPDRPAIETFAQERGRNGKTVHAECGLSLREAMIHLAACDVFISSDSGLMHVAAALGVPTIGLFGPTHPALGFAPAGERATNFHSGIWCSPCHRHGAAECFRGHRFCFDELNIPAIADSVRAAMAIPWKPTHAPVSK